MPIGALRIEPKKKYKSREAKRDKKRRRKIRVNEGLYGRIRIGKNPTATLFCVNIQIPEVVHVCLCVCAAMWHAVYGDKYVKVFH